MCSKVLYNLLARKVGKSKVFKTPTTLIFMCSINAANGGATFSGAFKLIKQHRVRLNTECTMGNSGKESPLLKLIIVDAKIP